MNLLFICKHNKFRSRVACAYFKKINKNKNIHADSAGLIHGSPKLGDWQLKLTKKFGIDIRGIPKGISTKMLKETDMIVVVANDVPKEVLKYNGKYLQKVVSWGVKDEFSHNEENTTKIIKKIMKKTEALARKLKNAE